ncbi:MAG: serine/threonine-protein kinase [Victivallaceae bacterium]|nr:serine/threonine-protein kinase [Victivallaceae bacterium]
MTGIVTDKFNTRTQVIPSTKTQTLRPEEINADALPVKSRSRYHFVRSIGFGGMKSVLLVFDEETHREVAMAMMVDYADRPAQDLQRFVNEALITASLEHPNIVPVYDVGKDPSGCPFFVMRYLKGKPLSLILSELRRGREETLERYALSDLIHIFIRICNAVEFAHAHGVLHLDLKPANVMIGRYGEVQLIDWGLARRIEGKSPAPTGKVCGTVGYIAPEVYRGEVSTERSDIYALGGLLFAMLTFRRPGFCRRKERTTTEAPAEAEIFSTVFANAIRPVPSALEAVCRRAMAERPEWRYHSVAELISDIRAYQAGHATTAENATYARKVWLFCLRHWMLLALGVSLLLLLWMFFA